MENNLERLIKGNNMRFDIHQYDNFGDELSEKKFWKYKKAMVKDFLKSEEGAALLSNDSGAGDWVSLVVDYGYNYIGVFPTQMSRVEMEEILTELFPRKVAVSEKVEIDEVIPELIAFWKYMSREHQPPHATSVLRFLKKLQPEFYGIMTDSSRFGMGKSMVAMGTEMGFNMTDEVDIQRFMLHYNQQIANTASEPEGVQRALPPRTRNQRKRMRKR